MLHICSGSKLILSPIYSTCSKEYNFLASIIEEYRNPKIKQTSRPFGKYFKDEE